MIALGGIGPSARVALPTVLKATKDPHWFAHGLALEALIKIKVEPDVAIPPLISALHDEQGGKFENRGDRPGAAWTVGEGGVPALEAAAADGSFSDRPVAASALRLIQGAP